MGTETLGGARPVVVFSKKETEHISHSFTNNTGSPIEIGQEVKLTTAGVLALRTLGSEYPVGVVQKGGADGETVVVATPFIAILTAKNKKGSTLDAGVLLKPDGTIDADGRPGYKPAAAGEYASGYSITGGINNAEVKVGILRTPVQVDAPATGAYLADAIKATNISQTIDFGSLQVGDVVQHVLVADGTTVVTVVAGAGTLGVAAVVNDWYFVYRPV